MNNPFLRLLGIQIIALGLILSVLDFFIENSVYVIIVGLIVLLIGAFGNKGPSR